MSIIYITRLLQGKCKISPSDHSWVFLKGTIWVACKSNPKKSTADFGVFCVVSSPPGFVCPLMLFWEWGTNRFSNRFKWQLKHLKMTKLSNRHESSRVLSVYEGGVQRRPGNTKNLLAKKWRDLCLRPWLKFQYLENPLDLLVPDGVAQMLLYIGVTFSFSTCFSCWGSFPPCFFVFWTVPETFNGKNMLPYHAPWSWWFEGQIPRPSTVPSHWRKDSRH